jgi:hypothetical protein
MTFQRIVQATLADPCALPLLFLSSPSEPQKREIPNAYAPISTWKKLPIHPHRFGTIEYIGQNQSNTPGGGAGPSPVEFHSGGCNSFALTILAITHLE